MPIKFLMEEKYSSDPNTKQLVRDYEDQLKNGMLDFFPAEHFEIIIDYYSSQDRYTEALDTCSLAIERYPFSTELKFTKAQILSNLGKYDEALELLDSALVLQPNDEEILLVKGSILSLMGQHKLAIIEYKPWSKVNLRMKYYIISGWLIRIQVITKRQLRTMKRPLKST